MARYVSRPRMTWVEDPADRFTERDTQQRTITVFEPDGEARHTGILDSRGHPVVAIEERRPIGFVFAGAED